MSEEKKIERVRKADDEWRAQLTPEQYRVTAGPLEATRVAARTDPEEA